MRRSFLLLTPLMLLMVYGCNSPELARSPYGPTELKWKDYVKKHYPAWNPPKTIPPLTAPEDKEEVMTEEVAVEVETETEIQPLEVVNPEKENLAEPVAEPSGIPAIEEPKIADKVDDIYVVQKGDSLWRIAAKYYQNGAKWKKILDANKDVLPSASKLRPGMKLRIPPE